MPVPKHVFDPAGQKIVSYSPLWNRFVLAGEPLLAVQQPAALHPLTWLGFLLPFPQAWTFQMSARVLVALLSAFLFCRSLGGPRLCAGQPRPV